MRIRIRTQILVSLAAVVAATCLIGAQTPAPTAAGSAALTQAIPVDPQITTGRFANGLRYYIRANKKPANRGELRLVVNAGSILEEDDQQGLAHFVEHMAFNGTKHFPKQDVVKLMESLGMRFGPHVNAYTSFDETVYQLQVPTDKPDVLDKSFQVLEDWAHDVSFEDAEIDKERGVVMEEWRLGRGADARMRDKQFPVLLKGSRYAERLPIGKPQVLENFPHDRLKKFYADWYRPDLMAVVAVGDFDKAAVEALIRQHFSAIPAAAAPKPRPAYSVPDHPETLYTIATDKEAGNSSVSVYSLMAVRDQTTVGAYRRQILENLFSGMLNARFAEIAQKPNAPFLGAGTGRGLFVHTREATTLSAGVKDEGIEPGLDAMFTEAARVARFGFTQVELERQKTSMLRYIERAVTEKDNQESANLAAEYIRNFLDQEPIPGIVYENDLYHRFVPAITLAEVNALAKDWLPDSNRVVTVNMPEKPGLPVPTEARLAALMSAAASKTLTPWADNVDLQPLMTTMPTAGAIVKTTTKAEFGVTEWELSNGVKVVLKPKTFNQDEVVFRATSPGGTSLASDADYIPAVTASQVVAAGGLGKFSSIDLRKILTGKVASVSPGIDEESEGMGGQASRKDLETLFQLIHLRFTQPRPDPDIFGVITSQTKAALANQEADPDFAFNKELETTLFQNHPRRQPITAKLIDQMNLDKSVAFYKDRFADASDFTFTFVGSFDLDTLKPLVERYLASLPALHRKETWKDIGARYATGVIEKKVEKGIEPKSQTVMVFTGPFQYNQDQRIAIRAVSQVLETRLLEVLREDLGGTYSVSVGPSYDKIPREEYRIDISFGSNPTRTEDLVKTVLREIELLKTNGPTEKQVADVKQTFLRDLETNSKQNSFYLTNISLRYQYGEDLTSLFHLEDYYNKLTPAVVQQAAKTYFNSGNYVKVELFPEKKEPVTVR
jgi:zinc protease